MFSSSLEKCDLTVLFKSWLWSYHSCLLLSSSLSNMHTQIFTDHIPFVIFLYHYRSSTFPTEVDFQGKNAIWENGNIYWKVLVPLKQTGAALAVLLAGLEYLARNQLMGSVGGNVMIEGAVDCSVYRKKFLVLLEFPYWAGTNSEI